MRGAAGASLGHRVVAFTMALKPPLCKAQQRGQIDMPKQLPSQKNLDNLRPEAPDDLGKWLQHLIAEFSKETDRAAVILGVHVGEFG